MTIYRSEEGPPDETIYAALGRLVYAFTELEASLLNALSTALGDTEEAEVVLAGLNFNQALDRFSVLYAQLEPVDYERGLRGFCAMLSELNEERNRQIHSNWGFWGSGEPMRAKRKLRRNEGVAFRMEAVKPEEVVQLANRMSAAADMVYQLRRQYAELRHVLLRDFE